MTVCRSGLSACETDTTQALNQTYPGRPCASRCSPSDAALGEAIHVVPGAITTSKDFLLDPGATVNGTITDGALPINSVTVSAYRQSGGTATLVRSGVALNNGAYSIRGLDPGVYYLLADDDLDRFVTELFGGVHCARCDGSEILGGTAIAIAAGTVINGRDFVLDLASRVRGRVSDATSGVPLAGVAVNVYAAASPAHAAGQATTGTDGNYNVRGLPSATVFASTANAPRHLNEIFDDVACTAGICSQSATVSTGLGIGVGGGGVASGINFVLARRNDVPTAPTGLTATAVGFAVQVTWQAPTGGAPATSYLLEAGVAPGTTAITAATPVTSLFAPGVGRGVYYLRVRGVNAFGIGPASAEFALVVNPDGSATPLPPTAPVAWTAGSRLTMTWLAPTLGPTPTGYAVEAGTAAGLANLGTLPVTTTSFSFDPVPPGFYFLRARSRVGVQASAPSPEVMITVGNVPAPPSPPQALSSSVAGSDGDLHLDRPRYRDTEQLRARSGLGPRVVQSRRLRHGHDGHDVRRARGAAGRVLRARARSECAGPGRQLERAAGDRPVGWALRILTGRDGRRGAASYERSATSTSGRKDSAGCRTATSRNGAIGVSSGFTSMVVAPARLASSTRPAAGKTTADVPTVRNTSLSAAASTARPRISRSSGSPNQTTPGRSGAPQCAQRGGRLGIGTVSSRRPARPRGQPRAHRTSQIDPCNRSTPVAPARSCRPSTFWVTSVVPGRVAVHRASTSCAALGWHAAIRCRRQSYHSHTSRGSRANASGVARSSGRC